MFRSVIFYNLNPIYKYIKINVDKTLTEEITEDNNLSNNPVGDYVRFLDGYRTVNDGYTENPFAHYENVSSSKLKVGSSFENLQTVSLNGIAPLSISEWTTTS